jgi:hypothetical protein
MTLNNSMSITPMPPAKAKGARFEHGEKPVLLGSTLSGNQQRPLYGPPGSAL